MNCLCANTRRAARSLTRLYEQHLRESGLTPAQFELMSMLAQRPGMAQTELAEACGLDQTTLSRNMRLLIDNKWVKRTRSRQDARQTLYEVTPTGFHIQQAAVTHWQQAQREMRRSLGGDWESALALLTRLTAAASAHTVT